MKLQVNPNRMELLRLKRRLSLARRGHNLLEDKLEQLMPKFLLYVRQAKEVYAKIKPRMLQTNSSFILCNAKIPQNQLVSALSLIKPILEVELKELKIMNVKVPDVNLKTISVDIAYDFQQITAELDSTIIKFTELMPDLILFGQLLRTCQVLSSEIERTRRRVNALKYLLIPSIMETIAFIEDKLNEFERENLIRLMRVKEIVRSH